MKVLLCSVNCVRLFGALVIWSLAHCPFIFVHNTVSPPGPGTRDAEGGRMHVSIFSGRGYFVLGGGGG